MLEVAEYTSLTLHSPRFRFEFLATGFTCIADGTRLLDPFLLPTIEQAGTRDTETFRHRLRHMPVKHHLDGFMLEIGGVTATSLGRLVGRCLPFRGIFGLRG